MYQSITAIELEQVLKQEDRAVLDVRDQDAFVAGHIPGAVNIPIDELADQFSTLDKNQPYMIICYAGGRSQAASEFLAQKGYQVTNVMGGMGAWRGEVK
ncbi:rhodanese-like domain-containing protein [Listeria costaricensis]|uniref:rhodanese-like domain-containing protein n=1 Tax=Listeria costaricensis TaxID=2026604 RepID=UPI000C070DBF|nr:rhodanese-like domain-containing protein [Listeria costaricensis]